MIRVDKFGAADYVHVQNQLAGGFSWWSEMDPQDAGRALEQHAVMYTLREGEQVLGIFGAVFPHNQLCELGFLPGEGWQKRTLAIIKILKRFLAIPLKDCQRVQAVCLTERGYIRFAQIFGFQVEGILRKYDRLGRDYFMLSIIKEG